MKIDEIQWPFLMAKQDILAKADPRRLTTPDDCRPLIQREIIKVRDRPPQDSDIYNRSSKSFIAADERASTALFLSGGGDPVMSPRPEKRHEARMQASCTVPLALALFIDSGPRLFPIFLLFSSHSYIYLPLAIASDCPEVPHPTN